MNVEFWLAKWDRNEIGFHAAHPHKGLVQYFPTIGVARGARVFVPLCGKTLDIHWMIKKGYSVVGVELSRLAVEQLFAELGIHAVVSSLSPGITVFEGPNIKVFVADIFCLTADMLGPVDIIYDRAALVALSGEQAPKYARHLMELTKCANQFLICVEYDQARLSGPPFAVLAPDVERYYAHAYKMISVDYQPVPKGIKGREPGYERIWFLQKRDNKI